MNTCAHVHVYIHILTGAHTRPRLLTAVPAGQEQEGEVVKEVLCTVKTIGVCNGAVTALGAGCLRPAQPSPHIEADYAHHRDSGWAKGPWLLMLSGDQAGAAERRST